MELRIPRESRPAELHGGFRQFRSVIRPSDERIRTSASVNCPVPQPMSSTRESGPKPRATNCARTRPRVAGRVGVHQSFWRSAVARRQSRCETQCPHSMRRLPGRAPNPLLTWFPLVQGVASPMWSGLSEQHPCHSILFASSAGRDAKGPERESRHFSAILRSLRDRSRVDGTRISVQSGESKHRRCSFRAPTPTSRATSS